jgi:pimeloyl-ACP methyl ester carboxylesterase
VDITREQEAATVLRLGDGRHLGYAEYGDRAGQPVLYFPGTPGSRLLYPPEEPTRELGVRLIVVERPGFGRSDPLPGRTLLDWPRDVDEFALGLGLDRFPVVGISAGGPYALACGHKLPHRLTRVVVIGGVGPLDVPGALQEMPPIRRAGAIVARRAPWLLKPLLWLTANPQRNPERFFQRMASGMSEVDREAFVRYNLRPRLMRSYAEAMRQGIGGFARETVILSGDWGFRLQEVLVPVDLWHGKKDHNVSLSAARYVAQALPNCRAVFLPNQGHWLFMDRWGEILTALLE